MRWRSWSQLVLVTVMSAALGACAAKKGGGSGDDADGSGAGEYSAGYGMGTLERIFFEFDASTITSKASSILKSNAKTMKNNAKMRVLVEGHCDERGTTEYNIALGERRAKATLDYLVSLGVERNRLDSKSWGEERPLDTAQSESAYKKNRRAEFVIMAK